MNEHLKQSLMNGLVAVVIAAGIDLSLWQDARVKAKREGKKLPAFDWRVAWPRYATAFIGAFVTTYAPGNPVLMELLSP